MASSLQARHIQDHSVANNYTLHWGYASRVTPCKNDVGSCEYLDAVYWMHDVSMLYSFIMWAVIGGLALMFVLGRLFKPTRSAIPSDKERQHGAKQGFLHRATRSAAALSRKYLLPESFVKAFGHVSRLQLLLLAVLSAYLLIFSMVGIVYKKWVTPVKNTEPQLYNTRTGLGGFADRVGVLAYALTPLMILLSSRESVLSLITGIPYQHFMFLHRWTGRIILIQSLLHTLGWVLIETWLYQPQPKVWNDFIAQEYAVWGVVAMVLLTIMYVMSIRRVIKWTGYEVFRKSHYVIAALYMGACWAHWSRLACWLIAALGLWFIDRGLRLLRTFLIHFGYKDGNRGFGFRSIEAQVQSFVDSESTVIRMTFTANHEPWKIGQHYFLCFPGISVWQSHPFTPASLPAAHPYPSQHTYIIRAQSGETAKLAAAAHKSLAASLASELKPTPALFTTPVILGGPYGQSVLDTEYPNILTIAGGTGISFTLPIALAAATLPRSATGQNHLVWIIRRTENIAWVQPELAALKALLARNKNLRITIYVTRDDTAKAYLEPTLDHNDPAAKETTVSCCAPPVVAKEDEITSCCAPTPVVPPIRNEKADDVIVKSTTNASHTSLSSSTSSASLSSLLLPYENFNIIPLTDHRPSLAGVVSEFVESTVSGPVMVAASGPLGLGADLRTAVAACNRPGDVWRGEERGDVRLVWDDRLG